MTSLTSITVCCWCVIKMTRKGRDKGNLFHLGLTKYIDSPNSTLVRIFTDTQTWNFKKCYNYSTLFFLLLNGIVVASHSEEVMIPGVEERTASGHKSPGPRGEKLLINSQAIFLLPGWPQSQQDSNPIMLFLGQQPQECPSFANTQTHTQRHREEGLSIASKYPDWRFTGNRKHIIYFIR